MMAFLVRCPCCAAPKRIDPTKAWEPETVECPRCHMNYEACAGHGVFTLSERGPWTRLLGPSQTIRDALDRVRAEELVRMSMFHYGYAVEDILLDRHGNVLKVEARFPPRYFTERWPLFSSDLVA